MFEYLLMFVALCVFGWPNRREGEREIRAARDRRHRHTIPGNGSR